MREKYSSTTDAGSEIAVSLTDGFHRCLAVELSLAITGQLEPAGSTRNDTTGRK